MTSSVLHQVEDLLDQLTPSEQALLLENLARRMRLAVSRSLAPRELYGIWKDKFPKNADVEVALHEIRQGWTLEWNDAGDVAE